MIITFQQIFLKIKFYELVYRGVVQELFSSTGKSEIDFILGFFIVTVSLVGIFLSSVFDRDITAKSSLSVKMNREK